MFSSACLGEQKEFLQVTWRQPYSTQEVCLIYDKGSEEIAYSRGGRNSSMLLHLLHYTICVSGIAWKLKDQSLRKSVKMYKNFS
jgi:hypothetical protein